MTAAPDSLKLLAQTALLGEIPSSLRCFRVWVEGSVLKARAIFDATATPEHIDCAHSAIAEILAGLPSQTALSETVVVDPAADWHDGPDGSLVYLRYGELSAT